MLAYFCWCQNGATLYLEQQIPRCPCQALGLRVSSSSGTFLLSAGEAGAAQTHVLLLGEASMHHIQSPSRTLWQKWSCKVLNHL